MSHMRKSNIASALSKQFNISMESEQEIEITTDEVVINQLTTIDGEMDELSENTQEAVESDDNLDKVEEATATLESLIASMESSILLGGFNKQNANLANIALESVATRFDLDASVLSFGMEAVEDDAEGETKSTIGKAKEMLSALKSNTGALINKMYLATAAALGNTAAISSKLISKATSLRTGVNSDNKGGNEITVGASVARKLTNTNTPLSPEAYVKELKRALDKYTGVVNAYADTDVLSAFIKDAVKKSSKSSDNAAVKKAVIQSVKLLSEGITKSSKSTDGSETSVSDTYLGNVLIARTRPTTSAVVSAMSKGTKQEQVSQESILGAIGGGIKTIVGAVIFTLSLGAYVGVVFGAANVTVAAVSGAAAVAGVTFGSLIIGYGIIFLLGYIAVYGVEAGYNMMVRNGKVTKDQLAKSLNAGRSKAKESAVETATIASSFTLNSTGNTVSTESGSKSTPKSLSATQVSSVASLVINTSATTKKMKEAASKRNSIVKEVNELTKTLSAENKGENSQLAKASATFIKNWIKQTLKFEMEMTNYAVGIMKAALVYAEASNSATVSTETILEDDGVENPEILEDVVVKEDPDAEADVTVVDVPKDVTVPNPDTIEEVVVVEEVME